jgi:Protein of unknown function (DUF2851)
MNISPIREDFLHFLWRTKKILAQQLVSDQGFEVSIISYGTYNKDAGPDFFNAKIKIGETIWAGNVEMHVFSSDWQSHRHQNDPAYENVILHVVYEMDKPSNLVINGRIIPTIALKGKIPKFYLDNYLHLVQSNDAIPCERLIKNVDTAKVDLWKYTLTIERLQTKSLVVEKIFKTLNHDWEETLYILIARYFGSKVNADPFERLARSLPLKIIQKNKDNLITIEALLFGQAGMLMAQYEDEYYKTLQSEYLYQQKKYQLVPINPVAWKFSKLRPANFATLRISQLAKMIYNNDFLFSAIKEIVDIEKIKALFRVEANEYWTDHYKFDTKTSNIAHRMTGDDIIDIIVINAVVPLLFYYGRHNDDQKYIDKAIHILEKISAEHNKITKLWKSLDVKSTNAFDSQALIHLKNEYCDKMRCLSCKIGNDIMQITS